MRNRTRSADLKVNTYEQLAYEGDDGCTVPHEDYCEWYVSHSGTHVEVSKSESMNDVVTPNFYKLSREGKVVNSPMDKTVTVLRDPVCSVDVSHGWESWAPGCATPVWKEHVVIRKGTRPSSVYTGGVAGMLDPPSIDTESLIAQALTKAHANVSLTGAQGLVMAAEGRKTIESLASIFKRLIKIIRKIKRLDARGLAGELSPKELADRYMEIRYALRPLVYDATDVVAVLNKSEAAAPRPRQTFRAYASETAFDDETVPYVDDWGSGIDYWARHGTLVKTASRSVEVRAGVLAEIYGTSGLATWGVFEPFEAAWELIPFSFIVDWFFNIGDTIGSLTPNYGLNELASWYVVTDSVYRETSLIDTHGHMATGDSEMNPDHIRFNIGGCYTSELVTTTSRVPDPARRIIPTFTLNLDAFKLTDLTIIAKKIWSR